MYYPSTTSYKAYVYQPSRPPSSHKPGITNVSAQQKNSPIL